MTNPGHLGIRRIRPLLTGLLLTAALAGLILRAPLVIETGREAVQVCLRLLIPSLFPFFVVSNLLIGTGAAENASRFFAPLMRGLFGLRGGCAPAFLLGLVGGYPVGARTAIALYRQGQCSRTEAERMLGFCSNCGPAFILGTVGTAVFSSARAGLLLYGVHIAASVCIGAAFRLYHPRKAADDAVKPAVPPESARENTSLRTVFLRSVTEAGTAVLQIAAFAVLFAVLIALFFSTGLSGVLTQGIALLLRPFGMGEVQAKLLLQGFLEVTSGLLSLTAVSGTLPGNLALAACLLGWAGLCVHCQVLTFLEGSGLSPRPYLLGKLAHGLLSALFMALLTRFFPGSLAASALLRQLDSLTAISFTGSLLAACTGALGCAWVFLAAAPSCRGSSGHRATNGCH